jgi:hypothetical protein
VWHALARYALEGLPSKVVAANYLMVLPDAELVQRNWRIRGAYSNPKEPRSVLSRTPEIEKVDLLQGLHHRLHMLAVEVVTVRLFMRSLIKVHPHLIDRWDAEDAAIGLDERLLVGMFERARVSEPLMERLA